MSQSTGAGVSPGNLTLQVTPTDTASPEALYLRLLNWRMALLRWGQALALGGVQVGTMLIPAAQILTSFTTPVEILAAPATNQSVVFISSFYRYTFKSVAFATADATVGLWFEGEIGLVPFDGTALHDLLLSTESKNLTGTSGLGGTPVEDSQTSGKGIYFASPFANPTTGDGDLIILLAYVIG